VSLVAEPSFGEALRQTRMRQGMSLGKLAQLAHYSKGYLSRVETGQRLPSAPLAHSCDAALRAGGTLAGLVTAGSRTWPAVIPHQLPSAPGHFVGRADVLTTLAAVLVEREPTAVATAIVGMAGVGKTAVAVKFAHQVARHFPDGQLYVNMRGFDASGQPVSPGTAIRRFLTALEVSPAGIPPDGDALAAIYRSVLSGRRLLIVADNARNAAHVRPLLPGTPGSMILITSRNHLFGLAAGDGAQVIDLDVLGDAEARQLLAARLGKDRLSAEPRAVDDIISLCGGLPLALTTVAARAVHGHAMTLGALAVSLRDSTGPLGALNCADDPATDLRAVFSWSYQALSGPAARLFRLLGLHTGSDIPAVAAASLAGLPLPRTQPLLAELVAGHLISESIAGGYAIHDLLRAYASHLALNGEPAGPHARATSARCQRLQRPRPRQVASLDRSP
jgi:hypothetical protein